MSNYNISPATCDLHKPLVFLIKKLRYIGDLQNSRNASIHTMQFAMNQNKGIKKSMQNNKTKRMDKTSKYK